MYHLRYPALLVGGFALGQQPIHGKIITATETNNESETNITGNEENLMLTVDGPPMMTLDEIHQEVHGLNDRSTFSAKQLTNYAVWNVRTLNQTGKLTQ